MDVEKSEGGLPLKDKMTIEVGIETYTKLTILKMETGLSDSELLEELIHSYYGTQPRKEHQRERNTADCLAEKKSHLVISKNKAAVQSEIDLLGLKMGDFDKREGSTENVRDSGVKSSVGSSESNLESVTDKPSPLNIRDDHLLKKKSPSEIQNNIEEYIEQGNSEDIPNSQIALVLLSMSQSRNGRTLSTESKNQEGMSSSSLKKVHGGEEKAINECKSTSPLKNNPKKTSGPKVFKCSSCSYVCKKKSDLNTHSRKHTGDRPFKCSQCPASFKQRPHLKYHELAHSGSKQFSCEVCEKSFRTKSKLRAHEKENSHQQPASKKKEEPKTVEKKKIWSCKNCDYTTKRVGDLKKHENVHATEKTLQCEFCTFKTSWKKNLIVHRRKHTGEQPHVCDLCDFKTHDPHALASHKVKIHSTSKGFVCATCGSVFSQGKLLRQHLVVHTGEKPYQCSQCSYKAGFQSNLRSHMMTHKAVKEFICEQCGKSFRWKHHLRGHQKNMHLPTEKVYNCEICSYTTTKSQSLNSHKRSHRKKQKKLTATEGTGIMVIASKNNNECQEETTVEKAKIDETVGTFTLINNDLPPQTLTSTVGNFNRDHSYSANMASFVTIDTTPVEYLPNAQQVNLYPQNDTSNTIELDIISDVREEQGIVIERASLQENEIGSIAVETTTDENNVITLNSDTNVQSYDQQGNNIFHYDGMAAVINNIIRDFDYHT